MKGFAKVSKPKGSSGPEAYLPTERLRQLLFPGADCRTVGGAETAVSGPGSLVSVQGGRGRGAGCDGPSSPLLTEGMDVEVSSNPPDLPVVSTSAPSRAQESVALTRLPFLQLMSQLQEMMAGQERLSKRVAEIAQAVPGTSAASVPGVASDPPFPEIPDTNPWKSCEFSF